MSEDFQKKLDAAQAEIVKLNEAEQVLLRHGFRRCEIDACNCGSWHHVDGLKARWDEIKEAVADAGYSTNGRTLLDTIKQMAKDAAPLPVAEDVVECDESNSFVKPKSSKRYKLVPVDQPEAAPEGWRTDIQNAPKEGFFLIRKYDDHYKTNVVSTGYFERETANAYIDGYDGAWWELCDAVKGESLMIDGPLEDCGYEWKPLASAPTPASAEASEAGEAPKSHVDHQQRRGAFADMIEEALESYHAFYMDDDFDYKNALDKICERLKERYEGIKLSPASTPAPASAKDELVKLTSAEMSMLSWLSMADSSAYGECKGVDLDRLIELKLASVEERGRGDRDYSRVSLTEAGWAVVDKSLSAT